MRNLFITLPLVTIMAAGTTTAEEKLTSDENCAMIAMIAENSMKARQAGVSLAEMLRLVADNGGVEIYRTIAIAAYEEPRMNVQENQDRMVSDFRDEWHLLCLKTLSQ